MKHIAILGSTGSIGASALAVARRHKDKFRITALSTNTDTAALIRQAKEFRPSYAAVSDEDAACGLKAKLGPSVKLFAGARGLAEMVAQKKIDMVLLAISGSAALVPLLEAIKNKKDIALANKEALVVAGELLMKEAARSGAKIIPVDSEQSAIWQCLKGGEGKELKTVYLTASGGPLKDVISGDLKKVSVSRVLRHPRWKMGRKITVDSATLMNKGLELLEAMFLFGLPLDKIRILIQPEAVIHSMVEFVDGVVIAQLSATDMRIPIQYALSYPERLSGNLPRLNFPALKSLHFEEPDFRKFPCLGLALRAARGLGTMPAVMNAANEVSVGEFLGGGILFTDIPRIIGLVMRAHRNILRPHLADILNADLWARSEAKKIISRLN